MKPKPDRRFRFVAPLLQPKPGGYFYVDVPERISKAIGKRGPVPVSAVITGKLGGEPAEFTASLFPLGGGRHGLRLNAQTREIAEVKVGDRVKVHITVLGEPLKVVIPTDLKTALRSEGVLEDFEALAPGKQNHIVDWINRSARPQTREKRIRFTVEFTHKRRECADS
jgi:hypothetical protein